MSRGASEDSKAEVFNREAIVDQLGEGIDADAEVAVHEFGVDDVVAHSGFYAFGDHGLIGDEEEGAGRDFVVETGDEDRGGFHVDAHAADAGEIFFEGLVVFPNAAVGGVDGAGPVIEVVVANGGGDRFLQGEGGQGGDFSRKVIGGRAFAADGGDGENEVAEFVFAF